MRSRRVAAALAAVLVAAACGGAWAQSGDADMAAMFAQMFGGMEDDGMEDGVGELLLSLQQLMASPEVLGTMVPRAPDAATTSDAATATATDSAGDAATTTASNDGTAAASQLLAGLFTGADSPFAGFLDGSSFPAFLSTSTPSARTAATTATACATTTSSGASAPLLGGALLGGAVLGSAAGSALAELLQPVAQSRAAVVAQLEGALAQSRSVLSSSGFLDDLFGGSSFELARFLSGDRQVLATVLAAAEEVEGLICSPPRIEWGEQKPTSCRASAAGHELTLSISGGACTFHKDKSVTCRAPRVVLVKQPPSCTKKHSTPVRVVGKECKLEKAWGAPKQGFLKPPKNTTLSLGAEDFEQLRAGRSQRTAASQRTSQAAPAPSPSKRSGLAALRDQAAQLPGLLRQLGQRLSARWSQT